MILLFLSVFVSLLTVCLHLPPRIRDGDNICKTYHPVFQTPKGLYLDSEGNLLIHMTLCTLRYTDHGEYLCTYIADSPDLSTGKIYFSFENDIQTFEYARGGMARKYDLNGDLVSNGGQVRKNVAEPMTVKTKDGRQYTLYSTFFFSFIFSDQSRIVWTSSVWGAILKLMVSLNLVGAGITGISFFFSHPGHDDLHRGSKSEDVP